MTRDEIRKTILDVLSDLAPEIDPSTLGDATDLREDVDLDSMDLLSLTEAIEARLGVRIDEREGSKLGTIGALLDHLQSRVA